MRNEVETETASDLLLTPHNAKIICVVSDTPPLCLPNQIPQLLVSMRLSAQSGFNLLITISRHFAILRKALFPSMERVSWKLQDLRQFSIFR